MHYFEEPEGIKSFKECIAGICEDDVATVSAAVYGCFELFKVQYVDIPNWMKTTASQTEWFGCLSILAKDILAKEINRELPFGTTNGVYMALLFFKAVAVNEDAHTLNVMSDYLEKFNRIGCQISNNYLEKSGLFNHKSYMPNFEASVH